MILNALCDYYDILAGDQEKDISPYGFEMTTARYEAVLSSEGILAGLNDIVNPDTKKPKQFMIPKSMKKPGIGASPVCDNFAYIFGISGEKGSKNLEEEKFSVARTLHLELFEDAVSAEAVAIRNFFEKWDINAAWENELVLRHYSEKGTAFAGNVVFRLEGHTEYFHECEEIKALWLEKNEEKSQKSSEYTAQCSITGEYGTIAKLHDQLKGVKGASTMGASLVCYNKDADISYNLEQSYNSSVSEKVAFKYTTVLKHMLAGTKQKKYIGDDTVVFWASSPSDLYPDVFAGLFAGAAEAEKNETDTVADRKTEEIIKTILETGVQGIYREPAIDPNVKFCVLGLAPNAGRVSVRFFYANTFAGFCDKIKAHYDDISIGGNNSYVKIGSLLFATVSSKSKDKKVNPLLGGAVMRAVLTGEAYPQILFNQALIRVKTETSITQARAAIIKGYIVRKNRILNKKEEDLFMYLNEESRNAAYVLGRVFAILEMIQKNALGDINATIKDKYFATACSNPSLVFPNLLKLTQHHLAKIEGHYWDSLLGGCLSLIEGECFPKILNTEDQGRFILGYYQQNQKLYTKKNNDKKNKGDE